jgi:AsmA protein
MQRDDHPEDEIPYEGPTEFDPADFEPPPFTAPDRKRVLLAIAVLVVLICAAVLPPLISVDRYRYRIAGSISESLGRPVHMESVTLDILPWPGFTLKQFVVGEVSGFGPEPIIRADTVRARIRLRSLWRRRVEFSRITLDDPSINLVRRADGLWNVESILLQAAKINADPTAEAPSGSSPRFPYISATGARINIKSGLEKLPISLTEADISLWLPDPQRWQLRVEGHPNRTDTAASDTGTFQIQGSFGKASTLQGAPVDLTAEWRSAPLGAVSWVVMGHDADFRGEMTLRAHITGSLAQGALDSHLQLTNLRRAEFVPAQPLDAEISCKAATARMFHQFSDVRCEWPGDKDKSGAILTGQITEILNPATASGDLKIRNVPAQGLIDALRLGTPRVSPQLTASGKFDGSLAIAGPASITGSMIVNEAVLTLGDTIFVDGGVAAEVTPGEIAIRPIGLKLGAPAPAALEAKIDRKGYTMHLSGALLRSRLIDLATALPQFGDGLAEALPDEDETAKTEVPIRVDLVSTHPWNGPQVWTPATARPAARTNSRRKR